MLGNTGKFNIIFARGLFANFHEQGRGKFVRLQTATIWITGGGGGFMFGVGGWGIFYLEMRDPGDIYASILLFSPGINTMGDKHGKSCVGQYTIKFDPIF